MKLDASIKLGNSIPIWKEQFEPVFIVGMNGSGTTMLLDSLGNHPDLYAYPRETRLIPNLIYNLERYGDLNDDENFLRLWHAVLGIPAFRGKKYKSPKPPLPENWCDFPRNLAAVLDAVFRYFALVQGKTRWCEKTPQHVQHMKNLHAIFPGAKFIHIIRDGRDCAASFHRRWRRRPELTIYRWKKVIQEGRKQAKYMGDHYLELKYEDVTTNPELWLHRICEYLEIPFHKTLLLSNKRQSQNSQSSKRIEQNPHNWSQYFNENSLKKLERIAGSYLQELGYQTQFIACDEDPSTYKLDYWKWMDLIREHTAKLSRKSQSRTISSWYWYIRRIATAIKQSSTNRY